MQITAGADVTKPRTITKIRILPPMVIARFGSSPIPMENYDLEVMTDAAGNPTTAQHGGTYRELVPALTLVVDPQSGSISSAHVPDIVQFRDGRGRIKPVCPFLEVWAQFDEGAPFEPLTETHLKECGLEVQDLRWQVHAANLKPFRRTNDPDDKVEAQTGSFSHHDNVPLIGKCRNFKPGKTISFGTVRFIRPTPDHPQIRLRFTPGAGLVFGPKANDPRINDDVYDGQTSNEYGPIDPAKGRWDRYYIGNAGAPPVTAPADIFQGGYIGSNADQTTKLSHGYFDDSCDGIAQVELEIGGKTLTARARFSSAVPDFAPDCLPVRSIADDVEQMALGVEVAKPAKADEAEIMADVVDILRRAIETTQQINTMVMNGDQDVGGVAQNNNNMPGQQTGYGRSFEPVFPDGSRDSWKTSPQEYYDVVNHHATILQLAIDAQDLQGAFPFTAKVRRPWQVADLSRSARQLMPAMMRGSEGLELCLTLRQINKLGLADPNYDPNAGKVPAQISFESTDGTSAPQVGVPVRNYSYQDLQPTVPSTPPPIPQED